MAKSKASTNRAGDRAAPAAPGRPRPTAATNAVAESAPSRAGDAGPTRATKQALIIGLLQREAGATLDDLVAATGWLPHTTRAALTRLRQAGHALEKSKGENGATVYRIAAPARATRSRKAA
jgi:hypothetical protein